MNNDLISRQAAVDAIKEFQHGAAEWRDEQEERSDIWHRADSAIASALEIGLRVKKLPSAQPEPTFEQIEEYCKKRRLAIVDNALLAKYASAQPERLTDDDFETIRIHLNAYKEKLCNMRRWEEAGEYQRIIDRLTAWMSLPEPYKADKEGET